MAQRHASALRQHRRSLRSRARNKQNVARLRTGLKSLRELIAGKDGKASQEALRPTISLIDHAVSKKSLHRNAAARLKSRLTRQTTALGK